MPINNNCDGWSDGASLASKILSLIGAVFISFLQRQQSSNFAFIVSVGKAVRSSILHITSLAYLTAVDRTLLSLPQIPLVRCQLIRLCGSRIAMHQHKYEHECRHEYKYEY